MVTGKKYNKISVPYINLKNKKEIKKGGEGSGRGWIKEGEEMKQRMYVHSPWTKTLPMAKAGGEGGARWRWAKVGGMGDTCDSVNDRKNLKTIQKK